MHGASERDFTDWPRGIVGQVRGQDADPQLPLEETHGHTLRQTYNYILLDTTKYRWVTLI